MAAMHSQDLRAFDGGAGTLSGGEFRDIPLRRDVGAAALAAAIAACVYIMTAAPSVTAEDSGELATAVATLGIPHPPGYPLYVLLGKAFTLVFPFGELAWRLNVFSGLLGGLAVGLAVLLAIRLSAPRGFAVAAGLVCAFTPILWSQSTQAEVYTLAAVATLVVCHLTLSLLFRPTTGRFWAVAYSCGIALTAHPICVLLFPGVLVAALARVPLSRARLGEYASAMGFFLLGFSIYLYLPIRSLADPVMDWGNPETLSGFLAHVLREQYVLAAPAGSPTPVVSHLLFLGYAALFFVGPVLCLLGILGAKAIAHFPGAGHWPSERAQLSRPFNRTYGLWILALSAGLLLVLTVNFQRHTLSLNSVFFVPLTLLLVAPSALGLARLVECAQQVSSLRRLRAGAALAGALPLCMLALNWHSQDRSGDYLARDYAENILKTLPEGSVYLPSGDHAIFPVLYLRVAEGMRPDVVQADKYGYLDPELIEDLCTSDAEHLRVLQMPRSERERWLIDRSGRPVFTNAKHDIADLPPERFLPHGILYRVDRDKKPLPTDAEAALWDSYEFRNVSGDPKGAKLIAAVRDIASEYVLAEVIFHEAERWLAREENEKALAALERLRTTAGDHREIMQNAGSLLAEHDLIDDSLAFYELALALDPNYFDCHRNLAWVLLTKGGDKRVDRAIEVAEAVVAEYADAPFLKALGKAYLKRQRFRNARDAFVGASTITPDDHEAWRLAGEVIEEHLKSPEVAKSYFSASLRLRPTQADLIEKVHGKAAREAYERKAKETLDGLMKTYGPETTVPGLQQISTLEHGHPHQSG